VFDPVVQQAWVDYYPNPTSQSVHFEGKISGALPARLVVYDMTGSKVHETTWSSNSISIDYDLPAAGIYYFLITNATGQSQAGKLIRM
ncbi:MAG TPA: T9SS type A sorting domain-containing protein, partial [Saprospiraceae bacterium]|nr:T9SS type A sorting domain-containing protein [Saprospiraceae bacterium]